MTEKLYIENFLGIKYLDIEVKKFNVIIGPQASGKSVCAKLLFFFKNFVPKIIDIVENNKTKRDLDKEYNKTFKEYFPPESWGSHRFHLKYQTNECFIEIKYISATKIDINYSDVYHKELNALKRIIRKISSIDHDYIADAVIPYSYDIREKLVDHVQNKITLNSTFNQFFIPAGRSFFATLENNIFSFLSSNNSLDPFLESFGTLYEFIKNIHNRQNRRKNTEISQNINKLVKEILCGTYIYEKGEDLLEVTDGRKIKLSISSSGQQEALPVTLILSTINFLVPRGGGYTFYIEEPEAHSFPNAQKKIVELIATVFNDKKLESQFFITTHSPYILTSLNNLIQAGSLYNTLDENQKKELSKIVPKSQAIDLDDIAVYSLENGKCNSLISEETELIDTNIIDNVSNDLAIEFDKLLDFI